MSEVITCPNSLQVAHIGDISSLKTEMETMKVQVADLSTMKDVLTRQVALQEQQALRDEKFTVMFEHQISTNYETQSTLKLINDNLSGMNEEMKDVKCRVVGLEVVVDRIPIENELKEAKQELATVKNNSFDIMGFVKDKVIPFLLGGGALYAISQAIAK